MILLENTVFGGRFKGKLVIFDKIYHFSLKLCKRYSCTLEKLIFSNKTCNRLNRIIFPANTLNGGKLSLEKGCFMKIYNISMKHTEQYSIQVKELVFFSNFSKISKFPVISSNGTALQWKI